MAQSVALKRPQGGARGVAVSCSPASPRLLFAEPCFPGVCGRRAPKYCLHCLGVTLSHTRSVAWAARGATLPAPGHPPLEGTLRFPEAAGQTHVLRAPQEARCELLLLYLNPSGACPASEQGFVSQTFGHQPGPICSSLDPGAHG